MTDTAMDRGFDARAWFIDKILMGMSWRDYMRSLLTPGNAIYALILIVGLPIVVYRFAFGIGAVSNLSQTNPWGLWIGLDVMSGVALAAGGFTVATAVYVFGLKEYHPIVRPAVLTGFLGYMFVVIGLCVDLGRPWKLPVPMVYSYGTGSVMFEVGWCVALYLTVLALEFSPAVFEWLGLKKAREWAIRSTLVLTINRGPPLVVPHAATGSAGGRQEDRHRRGRRGHGGHLPTQRLPVDEGHLANVPEQHRPR